MCGIKLFVFKISILIIGMVEREDDTISLHLAYMISWFLLGLGMNLGIMEMIREQGNGN